MSDLKHYQELVAEVGFPGSVTVTTAKLYPAAPEENRHIQGHHVGSWHFVARKRP